MTLPAEDENYPAGSGFTAHSTRDFELLDRIGEGGSAVVYRARNPTFDGLVALKHWRRTLIRAERRRFLEECRLQWRLSDHPNIVRLYWADAPEDEPAWLASELYEESLADRLATSPALTLVEALGLADDLLAGLEAIHAEGHVHRDVKPANILLKDGRAALGDLGIAMRMDSWTTNSSAGSDLYLAPELVLGVQPDFRSDVFSAGITIRRMFGVDIPHALDDVLTRATSSTPTDRPTDAAELRRHIRQCRDATGSTLRPEPSAAVDPVSTVNRATADQAALAPVGGFPTPSAAKAPVVPGSSPQDGPSPPDDSTASHQSRRRIGYPIAALVLAAVLALGFGVTRLVGRDHDPAATKSAATALPSPWKTAAALATPLQQGATLIHHGQIWAIGGMTTVSGETVASDQTEHYEPAIRAWTRGPRLPVAISHPMAADLSGTLYVIGGFRSVAGDPDGAVSNEVYKLDERRSPQVWTLAGHMNHARAAAAAVVVGKVIIVAGGRGQATVGGNTTDLIAPTEIFNGTTWRDVAPIPTPRDHLGAASDGRNAYFVGGRGIDASHQSGALECFDPLTGKWSTLAKLPLPRGGIGATFVEGLIVVAGGEEPTTADNVVDAYSIIARRWSTLPAMPKGVHGAGAVALGPVVYVVGGAPAAGHVNSTTAVHTLDLSSLHAIAEASWTLGRPTGLPRQQAVALLWSGKIAIVGGLQPQAGSQHQPLADQPQTDANDVLLGDPALNAWTRSSEPLPLPLNHAMAVTYHGHIIVLGGFIATPSDNTVKVSDAVFEFDGTRWTKIGNLRTPRASGAAVVVGEKIIVSGGLNHSGPGGAVALVPTTEVGDGPHWRPAPNIPTPRDHLAGVSDGRYAYFTGGRQIAPGTTNQDALERFDPTTNTWLSLTRMPNKRGDLAATISGNLIITAGSEQIDGVSGLADAYDITLNAWVPVAPMLQPRHGSAAVTANGSQIWVIGGGSAPSHQASTDTVQVLHLPR